MKRWKLILNVFILFLVTGLTIYYLIKSNLLTNISVILEVAWYKLIFLFGLVIIFFWLESAIIYTSIKRFNNTAKFKDGMGSYLIGNLGSNVTPWKAGHFPFMAYFYSRKKYSLEETLTIFADNHLVYSTTLSILYSCMMIVAIIFNFNLTISDKNIPLFLITLFGVLSNIAYLLGIIILIKNKKIQEWILKLQILFTKKFRKKVDIGEYEKEKRLQMVSYEKCFKCYTKNFKSYFKPTMFYFLAMIINYGLPYFIYLALSGSNFDFIEYCYFFMLIQAMKYVSNIIPVPGGSGVTEFCFIIVYQAVMTDTYVGSCLLIWRLLTYFIFIVIDFIYFLIFNSKNQVEDIKKLKEN